MSTTASRRPLPWLLLAIAGLLLLGGGYLLGRRGTGIGRSSAARARPRAENAETAGEAERGQEKAEPAAAGIVRFQPESLALARLRVEPVRYRDARSQLAVTGTVEPDPAGTLRVTSRVTGKIQSVRVNVGDTVRAGQPLATLASTELAEAQAAYRQAAARAAVAGNNLQRQEKLARLEAFGRPPVEAARAQATAARADVDTARSDVTASQAAVAEAESQLRALRAAREQARAQVQVTQSRFNRADLLLKEEIVSRQDWEQAQADHRRAQADVEAAGANIAQGQARVETARAGLAAARTKLTAAQERAQIAAQALAREEAVYKGRYTTRKEIAEAQAAWRQAKLDQQAAADHIRLLGGAPGGGSLLTIGAPLSGRVTERSVTLGETVTPDKMLFTILNLRAVWVQLNLYPQDIPAVRIGQAVTVTSDTAPGRAYAGVVSSISDVMEEASRTVKVRCVIQNPAGVLRPRAFVLGTIATDVRRPLLAAPRDAIQQMDGKAVVFTPAGKPGEFRARPVETGDTLGAWVEIRSGLKAGERIVTGNAFLIKAQAVKGELGEEEAGEAGER